MFPDFSGKLGGFYYYFTRLPWPSNKHSLKRSGGVPVMVQQKRVQLGTMMLRVRSLALLSGLRIQRCRELWCRWQTQLSGSDLTLLWPGHIAVTPNLGTSICLRCGPRKDKKRNKKRDIEDKMTRNKICLTRVLERGNSRE